jgi:hypothetical protein
MQRPARGRVWPRRPELQDDLAPVGMERGRWLCGQDHVRAAAPVRSRPWRWPPDRSPTARAACSDNPSPASAAADLCAISVLATPRAWSGSATAPLGAQQRDVYLRSMHGRPRTSSRPRVAGTSPPIAYSKVVFPEPDGPVSRSSSPDRPRRSRFLDRHCSGASDADPSAWIEPMLMGCRATPRGSRFEGFAPGSVPSSSHVPSRSHRGDSPACLGTPPR